MTEVCWTTKAGEDFIQIPNINCYTTCIMTRPVKDVPTSNQTSELIMHTVNLTLAINKCLSLLSEVNKIAEHERDALQEKGNTARRYFEYVLMLTNIRAEVRFEKAYQDQMLGNLTPVIRSLGLHASMKRISHLHRKS